MSYIARILQPGEQVLHRGEMHWIIYAPGVFLLLFAVASMSFALFADLYGEAKAMMAWLTFILLGGALYFSLMALIGMMTTEIAVTNRRVIVKTGWIRRRTSEMNMAKIESVDVDQSILGRFLDFGTIIVRGTGAGLNPIGNIAAPIAFRNSLVAG